MLLKKKIITADEANKIVDKLRKSYESKGFSFDESVKMALSDVMNEFEIL